MKRRSMTAVQLPNTLNHNILAVGLYSNQSFSTIQTTNQYNEHFDCVFSELNQRRQDLQNKISTLHSGDTSYRNEGVGLAWKYERMEIEMGGTGSGDWSEAQRQEILVSGKARGAEGHHINSVKAHPDQQANPDNIEFVKSREEHKLRHGGDFKNPTEGELIDRNERLEGINKERVFKNELTGIGLATAIGLGVGFTIGVAATLAQHGISADSIKLAAGIGLKTGAEASALAAISHAVVSKVGELISHTTSQIMINGFGIQATENLLKICRIGTVGVISSIVFSTWLYIKLKVQGYDSKFAFVKATKSLGYSLGILFISIVSQGLWGGHAGIVVSLSIGLIVMLFQFIKHQVSKKVIKKIQLFSIEKLKPVIT